MNVRISIWAACLFLAACLPAPAQNCSFSLAETHTAITCPGGNDGSVDLSVNGSGGNYFFYWQSFQSGVFNPVTEDQQGLSAGLYLVFVTDMSNCTEILEIELPDGTGSEPLQIDCPQNMQINLGPGECSEVVYFNVTATDNCNPFPLIYQTDATGLSSGDAFPIGTTTLSFEVFNSYQTVACSFFIKIVEHVVSGNGSMSCVSSLNVSLDENCSAPLSAGVLLSGSNYGCYDNYPVSYLNLGGFPITPDDFPSYVGKTIYGRVDHPNNNSFCFSTIKLNDFLKPKIQCIDTLVVSCGAGPAEVHPTALGYAEATDNCGVPVLNYFDQFNDLSCNNPLFGGQYSAWIKRTWTAEDVSGNEAIPCLQYIFYKRKNLDDVVFPENLTDQPNALPSLECGALDDSPAVTGVPTVDGLPIYPNNTGQCEFQVSYSDNLVAACGGGYNILRTWTVNDACNNVLKTHIQGIQIKDKQPPVITCQSFYSVSTNTGDCKATLFVPLPQVSDDCSVFNVQIQHSSGALVGNLLLNVPIGIHQIVYRATDDCGNQSTCQMTLSVYDGYPPNAVCDASKSVSLTTTGQTSLQASIFNKGSTEDCGGQLQFSIRRLNDHCGLNGIAWANTAKFCCEDIGTTVPVELKVTDFSGNFDICSSVVHISDFMLPSITCPSSFTIACDVDHSDLSIFGKIATLPYQQNAIVVNGATLGTDGFAMDNCSVEIEETAPDININACNTGNITRHFKATDPGGLMASCSQQVTVVNNDPFYINPNNSNDPNDDVEYPPHITISGCSGNADPSSTGQPILLGNGCGQVSVAHSDQIISQTINSYVIKRKWTVTDFCQLGGGQGTWTYFQNITVQNSDVVSPLISGFVEAVKYCSDDLNCQSGQVSFSLQATDDCTPANQLIWQHWVDIQNDGTVDLTGNSNHVFGALPLGIHKTTWKVTDGAGNFSTGIQFLLVEDCLPPVPVCHDTLYVTLGNDGFLQLPAEFMQADYSKDNCTAYEDLVFFATIFDPNAPTDVPPEIAASQMSFECPAGIFHLQLWVGDEMDNWGKCQFFLNVTDYFKKCDEVVFPPISIDGNILTEVGVPVGQVTIQVNANAPAMTDDNGYYAFYDLPAGGDFSIVPRKNTLPLNGVTTFDLVLIRRHVLSVQLLDSPYKIIAADINKSGTVTTSDLVALQKLILYVDEDFTNNESWRFIESGFVFPDPLNPFATGFPEVKSFNNLSGSRKVDFIGVKIGDVNGSANTLEFGGMEGDM